jgi:DNA repair photolyase
MSTLNSAIKGRGTSDNQNSRYSEFQREAVDDGWLNDETEPAPRTEISIETPRHIITRNQSPDLPFSQSINPYRGCEHGCPYCFARPTHAYLGLSPGLDFETRLTAKPDAAFLLKKELQATNYVCSPIALGTNTDPYQPIERQYQITREILQLLEQHQHPCTIVTKSALVERDIDILSRMAEKQLIEVSLSVTTLDKTLARKLEPRASSPQRRLQTIEALTEAGIPVSVLVAPVIPVLTDTELEAILQACSDSGALSAGYILLRLPLEVSDLFEDWLHSHYPDMAEHVMARVRDSRDGKTNDPRFGHRFRGHGFYADMIQQRFRAATKKLGLNQRRHTLNCEIFTPHPEQMSLF